MSIRERLTQITAETNSMIGSRIMEPEKSLRLIRELSAVAGELCERIEVLEKAAPQVQADAAESGPDLVESRHNAANDVRRKSHKL